jgi:putative hemolysin
VGNDRFHLINSLALLHNPQVRESRFLVTHLYELPRYLIYQEFAVFSLICKMNSSEPGHDSGMVTPYAHLKPRKFALAAAAGTFEIQPAGHPQQAEVVIPQTTQRPSISIEVGKYQIRLAQSLAEREAACRLRFKVFNIELGEGLMSSFSTGLDQDQFDLFCDHLIVEDRSRDEVVGTYRMQSGTTAAHNLGYYSAQEFDFSPYEPVRDQVLELGRASIDRDHRSSEVLTLLWRGIAQYSKFYGLRYLIGCSSLNTEDPQTGWKMYEQLSAFLVPPEFRTSPEKIHELPPAATSALEAVKIPKLLKTYIGVGARICAAPAWDREFRTIDFLTLLDLAQLTPAARNRFLLDTHF